MGTDEYSVLCANCHRIHTYNEAQGKRKYD